MTSANTNDALQKIEERGRRRSSPRTTTRSTSTRSSSRASKAVYATQRDGLDAEAKLPRRALSPRLRARRRAAVGGRQGDAARAQRGRVVAHHAVRASACSRRRKAGALVTDDEADLTGSATRRHRRGRRGGEGAQARGQVGRSRSRTRRSSRRRSSLQDRATRERLFEASTERAEHGDANDTRASSQRLAELRARKAKLLGFPDLRRVHARRPDGEDARERRSSC